MKYFIFILFILCFFFVDKIQAQENIEEFIGRKLESILENTEENVETSELFEKLLEMAGNPININGFDIYNLLELKLITDKQYHSILSYRNTVGKIESIQEIQFLDGFNAEILLSIKPFIYAGNKTTNSPKLSELLRFSSQQLIIRYNKVLQAKAGYNKVDNYEFLKTPNNFYLGSPVKIYTKYKMISKDHLSAGFVLEKDPGEALFKPRYPISENLLKKQIPIIDFASFHVSASNLGIIKKIVLGDYHLQFGQGLTLWSNFAFNKSAEVTSIKRYANNIIPSTSTIENNFFRGVALAIEKGKLNLSVFYSNKNRDANAFETKTNGEISTFTSLQNTGLHRTINELNDRNILNEQFYGIRASFNSNTAQIGSTTYFSKWDATLLPSEQLYKIFDLSGNKNSCIGLDYQWFTNNASFYGEISMSQNKATAYLAGMDFHADSYSKFSILYRNYQPGYQNLYANAFAENSLNKNEKGLYIGFDNWILARWQIHFYLDMFRFPWLKSRSNAPSPGIDYFIQINHTSSEIFQIYLRYKHKHKQINSTTESWFSGLVRESKENIRLDLTYNPALNIRFKSRVEWVKYFLENNQSQKGILLFQQFEYTFPHQPMKIYFRYTNFNTDGFDSRIYTYENDVLYAFSIPSFYDIGNHFFLLFNYKVNESLNLWFRLGNTNFKNKTSIGTGAEEILGSSKTEIKFQLCVKL